MHGMKTRDQKTPPGWRRLLPGLCFGLITLTLHGCCGPTALERDYGKSWAYNQAVQIADPKAGLDPTPAVGLPPQAAANNMTKYEKGFSGQAEKGQSTTINLSPMTTGSGGK